MRDTIWRLWECRELDTNSELFYKKVMSILRGLVLKKIEFDDYFMEDQKLLSSNYE